MDTPAYTSPDNADNSADADPDAQFATRLEALREERDKILADAKADVSERFPNLTAQVQRRLQTAADVRDLNLAMVDAHFSFEAQQAWNEFERGKRRLQSTVLDVAADRRRRVELVRNASLTKKKKRARTGALDRLKSAAGAAARATPGAARPPHAFLASLEQQGLVRLVLTPDEVNADLAGILRGVDSARFNGAPPLFLDGTPDKSLDKIHSSRGILHYHDITFEKNDRVAIMANHRPKPVLKYSGVLQSVNSKELNIRTDDGNSHRVFVTHLRNGRLLLKPA